MLNRDELHKLRKQITLNSVYVNDYENNMGIETKVCCDFFDGFMSYINELFYEDHPDASDREWEEHIWDYDTLDNLEDWYNCFEDEPLPKFIERLIPKIEAADFSVTDEGNNTYYFGKYSPAGQDFGFSIDIGNNFNELADNIWEYYEDFDVSYETYIWLDTDGHGKNGAPYDMKDLYEDMEACEEFIRELYEIVREVIE